MRELRCSRPCELELVSGAGGRGNTNVWTVRDPRAAGDASAARVPRRVAPPTGARPLVASATSPVAATLAEEPASTAAEKGGQDQTVSAGSSPILTGVFARRAGRDRTVLPEQCPVLTGVSGSKGGQDPTLFELETVESPAQTPAKTPAETPAANVRAGREPLNPRIREDPPSPPERGSSRDSIVVEERYVTARGRTRRRAVRIDLDEVRRGLGLPGASDRSAWAQVRKRLRELVGESMFEIWLDSLELIAIDVGGALVIDAPPATCSWLRHRYDRLIGRCAEEASRALRFAEEAERQAFAGEGRAPSSAVRAAHINQREVS